MHAETNADTAAHTPTWADPLPMIALRDGAEHDAVTGELSKQAKRGRIAGFAHDTGAGTFTCDAFGGIFDRTLIGTVQQDRLTFTGARRRTLLGIVMLVFVLTLYPGVLLTHSLLGIWFSRYPDELWITVAWYVPLTLLAIPALLKRYRSDEAASRVHAEETIGKIARMVAGTVVENPSHTSVPKSTANETPSQLQ